MKISILLPYKENFSIKYAGAVSLFVKDTVLRSKFKKQIKIYGFTRYKSKFLNNYINLSIDNNNFFQSNSKIYVSEFLKHEKFNKSDLIEIHNRPNYIKYLTNETNANIFLYFHNDPLSMNGSKLLSDRKKLLQNTNRLIFNSRWSRDRFMIGLENYKVENNKLFIVYQSAKKIKINFKNKKKIISFVGKLNSAKGYDLFGKAIIKVLNNNPKWKSVVIGDEPREKLTFKHERLFLMGF